MHKQITLHLPLSHYISLPYLHTLMRLLVTSQNIAPSTQHKRLKQRTCQLTCSKSHFYLTQTIAYIFICACMCICVFVCVCNYTFHVAFDFGIFSWKIFTIKTRIANTPQILSAAASRHQQLERSPTMP